MKVKCTTIVWRVATGDRTLLGTHRALHNRAGPVPSVIDRHSRVHDREGTICRLCGLGPPNQHILDRRYAHTSMRQRPTVLPSCHELVTKPPNSGPNYFYSGLFGTSRTFLGQPLVTVDYNVPSTSIFRFLFKNCFLYIFFGTTSTLFLVMCRFTG